MAGRIAKRRPSRLARPGAAADREVQKELLRLNDEQRRANGRLESARRWLNLYQIAQRHVHHLPTDPFRTMALVIGLVVGCIAVKCVFEFGQESLVGSV